MKAINLKISLKFIILIVILTYASVKFNKVYSQSKFPPEYTPGVYSGELKNGFKYYIKPLLEKPDGRVHMELYNRAGTSKQVEGEWQLAHFIEHLPIAQFKINAYTKNKKLEEALDKNLIDIGGHVQYNFTQYSFSYPASNNTFRNIGLKFFSNLAKGQIQVEPEIINSEKGMIFEEIINRSNEASTPYQIHKINAAFSKCITSPVAPDSIWRYLKNFDKAKVDNFIKKWYRPDSSALVIIGNIKNTPELESKIKKLFSTPVNNPIKARVSECMSNILEKPSQFVLFNNENQNLIDRKEVIFHLFFREPKNISDLNSQQTEFLRPFINQVINDEIFSIPNNYSRRYGLYALRLDKLPLLDLRVSAELGHERYALKKMLSVLRKLKEYGIDQKQWKAIKKNGNSALHSKDTSSIFFWRYRIRDEFLKNKISSLEKSEQLEEWWSNLGLVAFNQILTEHITLQPDDIAVFAPITSEKDKLYWKTKIKEWLRDSTKTKRKTYKVNSDSIVLSKKLHQKGYKELRPDILGNRVFLLSNGAKVIISKKRKKNNKAEISLHGIKKVALSKLPKAEKAEALVSPFVIRDFGILNMDKFELENFQLNSSISRLYPYINETEAGIKARANEDNLEQFFKSVYGYLSPPRKDSIAFKYWQYQEWQRFLHSPIDKSSSDFNNAVLESLSIPLKDISVTNRYQYSKNVNMEQVYNKYNSIFTNAEGWTFLITTSTEADILLPLINKYLGNISNSTSKIPLISNKEVKRPPSAPLRKFIQKSSIPKGNTFLSINYLDSFPVENWRKRLQLEILKVVLSKRIKRLRYVKRRAIYDSYIGHIYNEESGLFRLFITIPTPKKEAKLIRNDIHKIIEKLQNKPIDKKELKSILNKEIIPEYYYGYQTGNSLKMKDIYKFYRFGVLPLKKKEVQDYAAKITPSIITQAAKVFLVNENKYEFLGENE